MFTVTLAAVALLATPVTFITPRASASGALSINSVEGGGSDLAAGISATTSGWQPLSVAVDVAGNQFITAVGDGDYEVLEVPAASGTYFGVSMTAGDIYPVGGNGLFTFSGNSSGVLATSVPLAESPGSISLDSAGDLYFTAPFNAEVSEIAATTGTQHGVSMTTGFIYTVVGDGVAGFSGDGGPATSAEINLDGSQTGFSTGGIAVDPAGDIYVADTANNRIREVPAASGTQHGLSMTAGDIYTIVGNGTYGYSADGTPAGSVEMENAQGVSIDAAGDLLVPEVLADDTHSFGGVLLDVPATTGTKYGTSMNAGDGYTIAGDGTLGEPCSGGPATSPLLVASRVGVDAAGDVFIPDNEISQICEVPVKSGSSFGQSMTAGDEYPVAGTGTEGFSGDGGPAISAELNDPGDVAVDSGGDLYIVDTSNARVREVNASANGTITITGTVEYLSGTQTLPAAGAVVQACSTTSGNCTSSGLLSQSADNGNYSLTVPGPGSYVVKAYPSPSWTFTPVGPGTSSAVTVVAGVGASGVDVTLPPIAGIDASGASVIQPNGSFDSSGVPFVNWGLPSTVQITNTECPLGTQEVLTGLQAVGVDWQTGVPTTVDLPVSGQTDNVSYQASGVTDASGNWSTSPVSVTETQTIDVPEPPMGNFHLHGLVQFTAQADCDPSVSLSVGDFSGLGASVATAPPEKATVKAAADPSLPQGPFLLFGDTSYGTDTPDTNFILVSNPSSENAFIGLDDSGLGDAFTINAGTDCSANLDPGHSCSVAVDFNPPGPGFYQANLKIGNTSIELLGRGRVPALSISPESHSFQGPGSTTFKVTNVSPNCAAGACPLTMAVPGGLGSSAFKLVSTSCTGDLTATNSCVATVQFNPAGANGGVCIPQTGQTLYAGDLSAFGDPPGQHPPQPQLTDAPLAGSIKGSPHTCPPPGGTSGGSGGGFTVLGPIGPFGERVDPSGLIFGKPSGGGTAVPLDGATATLETGSSTTGPFSAVPDGSNLMAPPVNPETTDSLGYYRWDVFPGVYEVKGADPTDGCTAVTSPPLVVPPPAFNVDITLPCSNLPALAPSTLALSSNDPTAPVGTPVTLSATVTSSSTPLVGTVAFDDGTTTLGTGVIDPATGSAEITLSSLASGVHSITATYSGDTAHAPANSSALTQTIASESPAFTSASSLTVTSGAAFTFPVTATGSPTPAISLAAGSSLPSGVTLTDHHNSEATLAGTSSVASGVYKFTLRAANGVAPIASQAFTLTVAASTLTATRTTLTSSVNPSVAGQSVTFTATVAPTSGTGTPTGTVTFRVDGTARPPVALANGTAKFSTASLTTGPHTITAAYSGDTTFAAGATVSLTQQVNTLAPTKTTLASSVNPSVAHQSVTFTATVTPTSGTAKPTGSVTFTIDGATRPNVALTAGVAKLSTTSLAIGSHKIGATYSGATAWAASNTAPFTQQVNPFGAPATIVVAFNSSRQSTKVGTAFPAPLAVRVSDAFGNPVVGATVTFKAPTAGASGKFTNGTTTTTNKTGTNGVTNASTFTANGIVGGPYSVTATVGSLFTKFSLTNTKKKAAVVADYERGPLRRLL